MLRNFSLLVHLAFIQNIVKFQLKKELLKGELEPTNQWYALTKVQGVKMCEAYNRQYNSNFSCVMPTNLFGINDKYDENISCYPCFN